MYDLEAVEQLCGGQPPHAESWYTLTAEDVRTGSLFSAALGSVHIRTIRRPHDAPDVRRLVLSWKSGEIELQPTKGLSIGPYSHDRWRPFWEPVVAGILSPDRENIAGELLLDGHPVAGLRWIENFSGCVELLGLSNWGMPRNDDATGVTLPLHGEAARIPVDGVAFAVTNGLILISASFSVNSFWWRENDADTPWYRRGEPNWRITRTILVDTDQPRLQFVDAFTNTGDIPAVPEWGYHLQLRAEPDAQLLIPSRSVEHRRKGEPVPERFRYWTSPSDPAVREERGYVHKGCRTLPGPFDTPIVRGSALYPRGPATLFLIPAAAYTLSWFSCGGAGSLEFTLPEAPRTSMMPTGWDGMGPEIGVSPLDHDGNVDPTIVHRKLPPGETTRLFFSIEMGESTA